MNYDKWITSGYSHKCACGSTWYDSDGGPCHIICADCGELIDADSLDDEGYCENCSRIKCKYCEDSCKKEEMKGELCLACAEELDEGSIVKDVDGSYHEKEE